MQWIIALIIGTVFGWELRKEVYERRGILRRKNPGAQGVRPGRAAGMGMLAARREEREKE